jgi:NADPH-dependent F420 reductase
VIGVVGGTGGFGQGLAARLRAAGEQVAIGSRRPQGDVLANAEAAAGSEVVFLAVPPAGVEATARELAALLAGKIVVSVAAPVGVREGRSFATPGELSLAELAAHAAPGARVVAGFHTLSAKALADLGHPLAEDVLLAGDDEEAKREVARLAELVVSGKAVDAGPLEVARWLEPFTAVLVSVNLLHRARSGITVTGLE